jgi:hypothetical protein
LFLLSKVPGGECNTKFTYIAYIHGENMDGMKNIQNIIHMSE